MSRTLALVPVKSLAAAKSRLAPSLTKGQRTTLSIRLLAGVLAALGAAALIDACWVIGGDSVVRELASGHGADTLPELGQDLNDTLGRALVRLPEEVTGALILPMDLPFLTGRAVDALVAAAVDSGADVVIAPDRWERGTNALWLTRPFVLRPAFGPESLAHHHAAAAAHGLRVALYRHPELAFDIDTPADLAKSGLFVPGPEGPP